MILTTTENISGKQLEHIGIVKGSVVQSKHIGKDIASSFKTIIGGEIRSYTQMLDEARAIATDRMMCEAQAMGADAVVCVRYASSAVMTGAAEIVAYGTALRFV